jgi:hypothetical protein
VLQQPFDVESGKALKGGDAAVDDRQPRAVQTADPQGDRRHEVLTADWPQAAGEHPGSRADVAARRAAACLAPHPDSAQLARRSPSRERSEADGKLKRVRDEESEIKQKSILFNKLQERGMIGEEQRLEWVELLKDIRDHVACSTCNTRCHHNVCSTATRPAISPSTSVP